QNHGELDSIEEIRTAINVRLKIVYKLHVAGDLPPIQGSMYQISSIITNIESGTNTGQVNRGLVSEIS
ncbi:unnamed protein product, partial [marine sediment metagenome]